MYKLVYKKSALKSLRKMPRAQAESLERKLEAIALAPHDFQGDWKPMKGEPYWRLRQGSFRAVCSVRDGELLVLVLKVGSRGDVYK